MDEFLEIVVSLVKQFAKPGATVSAETPLIGEDGTLDSMALVELCLALEDFAQERGFNFDWSSDDAMSRSRSFFRSPWALALELSHQRKLQE